MERVRRDGQVDLVADNELVQRSKLRIDSRKWLMSVLSPATYGEKSQRTTKIEGQLAVAAAQPVLDVTALSTEELRQRTESSRW